jgi:hypothetical protein
MESNHSYKGFNLLAEEDASLLRLLLRGEFANGSTADLLATEESLKTTESVQDVIRTKLGIP